MYGEFIQTYILNKLTIFPLRHQSQIFCEHNKSVLK